MAGLFSRKKGVKTKLRIVSSIQKDDRKNTEKLIAECRKKQLARLHESQACIDRLDYLSYQLGKGKELPT